MPHRKEDDAENVAINQMATPYTEYQLDVNTMYEFGEYIKLRDDINLLLEEETSPVVWRGPVVGGAIKQFWSDVIWNEVDYMFVDMPPGTGDVALTVFQSLPLDGIIIVTSPQDLVSMIVSKAVEMAKMMNIPILGLVENYSYVKCPCCGEHFKMFGESHIDDIAAKYGLKVLAKLPMDVNLAAACDRGIVEMFDGDWLEGTADFLETI